MRRLWANRRLDDLSLGWSGGWPARPTADAGVSVVGPPSAA